jgi:hypothetical protein
MNMKTCFQGDRIEYHLRVFDKIWRHDSLATNWEKIAARETVGETKGSTIDRGGTGEAVECLREYMGNVDVPVEIKTDRRYQVFPTKRIPCVFEQSSLSNWYGNLRGDGGMNELTSPAFASACGCGWRSYRVLRGGEVWGMQEIRDRWHGNAR